MFETDQYLPFVRSWGATLVTSARRCTERKSKNFLDICGNFL